jgi:UDP-GlcNAc:undecaprenyl-phosphate GlcNAc-1-phosphate transferase
MRLLAAGLTTLTLGLLLVPAVRALARRVGMVAAPRKDRWHSQPTALLGGVGIFVAFALGLVLFPEAADDAVPVLVASALLFVVGLVDDVLQIRPLLKLGLQVVAAGIVVGSGLDLPWTHQPLLDGAITMLWLVGITNAVNLLDNMDGLAAGISAIACVFLSVTFLLNGQAELAVLPALVCGAALGFLRYNFKPASIFMGDGGSMFLGSLLGGLALLSSYGRSRSVASVMMTPVLIMMIPILDTTLVTITRRLRGQPVSVGGRDHTSHRLVALGASERRAVVILYLVAAASGAVALVVRELGADALLAVIPAFALAVLFFTLYLGMVPVRQAGRTAVAPTQGLFTPSTLLVGTVDLVVAALAYVTAFSIRWDWDLPPDQLRILGVTLGPVVVIEMAVLWFGGIYRVRGNGPDVDRLVTIGQSVAMASGFAGLTVLLAYELSGPSRGALLLNGILLLVAVVGSRLSVVLLQRLITGEPATDDMPKPVLIYGTGEREAFLVAEVMRNPAFRLRPVGFVSDGSTGKRLMLGLPVFDRGDLAPFVQREGVGDVLMASTMVDGAVTGALEGLGLRMRTMRIAID